MKPTKSEFQLIDWIRHHSYLDPDRVPVGIGDDMAVMRLDDQTLLITTDLLLENVHFDLNKCTLDQVGYKAMAVSLSDCAAMAATPFVAVVAVALPNRMTMDQAQQLHLGLQKAARKYHCPIVGGDTTSWDQPLTVDVTIVARTEGGRPVLRSGAEVGDVIIVTGQLGGAQNTKHLNFEPRIEEAKKLAQLGQLRAMIDISDGLAADLHHICTQSCVTAVIDPQAIPISNDAKNSTDPLNAALTDGEDFELLFCVSPNDAEELLKNWPSHSTTPLTRIGHTIEPKEHQTMFLKKPDGTLQQLEPRGWEHFHD